MGITNPAEPHFRRGIWGWATSAWVKLVATAGGILKVHVAEQTGFLTVRQTVASYLVTSGYGWTGSAWRKLPMLWGYSDAWIEAQDGTADASGDVRADTDPVPEGYVYVLQTIAGRLDTRIPSEITFAVHRGAVSVPMQSTLAPFAASWVTWVGGVVLKKDDYVRVYIGATQNNDVYYARFCGYKMKIAES